MMATRRGDVNKTPLEAFSRPRTAGVIAINILDGDELLGAELTDGTSEVLLGCNAGRSIRFPETDVRPTGRGTTGVRGMDLQDGEEIIGMVALRQDDEREVLAISKNGFGKRTDLGEYRQQGRGGKGIKTLNVTTRPAASCPSRRSPTPTT